ncbi:hypothetical protein P5673_005413 [Acropora cervicornis]|uniref:G-protein coupled receptors family 1 profile domain-containing protein n=1 Tax=Acropora cervicornis TaxID=6130 RepID=A0AAD9QYG4_ACRCE|nr:hypothetical protein P5673_005413 [Acropora cervicornis]
MNNSQDWSLVARCPILVAYGGSHTQSSFFRPVIIFMLVVHILTCPFTVILNLLVMVAVKVKARLRANKSNTLLATLASTDFIAGLFVQPIFIAKSIATLLDKPFRQSSVKRFGIKSALQLSKLHERKEKISRERKKPTS